MEGRLAWMAWGSLRRYVLDEKSCRHTVWGADEDLISVHGVYIAESPTTGLRNAWKSLNAGQPDRHGKDALREGG